MSEQKLNKTFGGFGHPVQLNNEDINTTYVAIILDESGSMGMGADQTISNFNEQIQSIKDNDTELNRTFVSLFKFNTTVTTVMVNESTSTIAEMKSQDFSPRGMTALYDAVGLAIDTIMKSQNIDNKNTSVLFVILSDGHENASTTFTSTDIAEKIQACQDTDRWTFTYMGANVDLAEISETLNIPRGNITSFDASTGAGYAQGATAMKGATTMYMQSRSMGSASSMNCSSVDSFYTGDTDDESTSAVQVSNAINVIDTSLNGGSNDSE